MNQEKKRSISSIELSEHATKKAKIITNGPTVCQLFQITYQEDNVEFFYCDVNAESVLNMLKLYREAVQRDSVNTKSHYPVHAIAVALGLSNAMSKYPDVYDEIPELQEETMCSNNPTEHYSARVMQFFPKHELEKWKRIECGHWEQPNDVVFKIAIWSGCC